MMEMLLWRCPLCATNDGLRHQRRLFGKELVRCRTCRAVWQVSRVVGKDYQLRVIEGDAASLGLDLPLAEWYDRMKASLSLSPLQDAPMTLLEAESEYLHGSRVRLFAPTNDPTCFGRDAVARQYEDEVPPRAVGWGGLTLTSERLRWQSASVSCDFWLRRLRSVFAIYTILLLAYEDRTYQLRFPSDSPLKWLTYIAHAGRRVKDVYGHTITTSNF